MSKKRQLAAIVFTDISNFTSLMDKDESKALTIRRKQRDNIQNIIKEFDGQYIKEIGDGDLMMFNSATDAVNFTLKLQSGIKPNDNYTIRGAIHLGDIVREGDDIFGTGVNMASRIHGFVSPGCTVISDSVFKEIKNKSKFSIISIGKKNVKGIDEPINIYQVSLSENEKNSHTQVGGNYIKKSIVSDLFERRVPQFVGLYFAVSWGIIQFMSWLVDRYLLSPHLVDLSLAIGLSMIPSILILAYFHGRPGKDKWNRIEKIVVPANLIISGIILVIFFYPKNLGAITKDITIEDFSGNKITKTIIKSEFRKSYVIFNFENNTANSSNDWLGKGIRFALSSDLSQDIYLSNQSTRAEDIKEDMDYKSNESISLSVKQKITHRTTSEFFVSGNYSINDGLFIINVEVYKADNVKLINTRQYQGNNLFDLIDLASKQIKIDMEIPSAHIEKTTDLPVIDRLTDSLEALKYYILSLSTDSSFDDTMKYLKQAIEIDNKFALAHHDLYNLCQMSGDETCYKKHSDLTLKYIDKFSDSMRFSIRLDILVVEEGTIEQRTDLLNMWIDLYPNALKPYEMLSRFAMVNGEFDKQVLYKEKMLKITPENHNLILEIGDVYRDNLYDYDTALIYYNQYLGLHPENPEGYEDIAELYFDKLDFKNASKYLMKAQAVGASGAKFELKLINVNSKLNNWSIVKYVESLDKLIKQYKSTNSEEIIDIYQDIIDKLKSRGMYKKSIKYENEMIDFAENLFGPFFRVIYTIDLFETQKKLGYDHNAEETLKELTSMLMMPPLSYIAGFVEVGFYTIIEDWDKFNTSFDKAVEGVNKLGASVMLPILDSFKGEYFEGIGNTDSAIKIYQDLILSASLMVDIQTEAYFSLGRIYQQLDNFKESEKMFIKYFEVEDESAEGFYEYSILKEKQGKNKESLELITKAYDLYKDADIELELTQKIFSRYNKYQEQLR